MRKVTEGNSLARHVKILNLKTHNNNVETDPTDTLARGIFDAVNGKTVISLAVAPFGQNLVAVIVYDDVA